MCFALALQWIGIGFALALHRIGIGFALALHSCMAFAWAVGGLRLGRALAARWRCIGLALDCLCIGFAVGLDWHWICIAIAVASQRSCIGCA